MSPSKTSSAATPFFDWLKDYDRRARDFQSANDWTEYSLFALARFPHLRPTSTDSFTAAGLEWFSGTVASRENGIAQHPKAKLVLNDLSRHQRRQLAALVSDTLDDLEKFRNRSANKRWASKLAIEGKRRKRIIQSKYVSACRAVESLRDYSDKVDRVISFDFYRRAHQALRALRQSGAPEKPSLEPAAAIGEDLSEITHDPTTEAMVQLYWFFRSDCNLTGHESEVRVALIRNAFWTEFGIPKVSFRETYRTGESRGCDAVKQAVRRFRYHQGTTR